MAFFALLSSCAFSLVVCLTSPGRTADEEDWCGRGQTNRVWDEYRISPCWSAVHEGNCWPLLLKWSSNRTLCPHVFFLFIFQSDVWCSFLQVTWRDIAGLDEVINELQDTVILPFQKRHLLAGSKLFQPPKGITAGHQNGIKLWRMKETDNQLSLLFFVRQSIYYACASILQF